MDCVCLGKNLDDIPINSDLGLACEKKINPFWHNMKQCSRLFGFIWSLKTFDQLLSCLDLSWTYICHHWRFQGSGRAGWSVWSWRVILISDVQEVPLSASIRVPATSQELGKNRPNFMRTSYCSLLDIVMHRPLRPLTWLPSWGNSSLPRLLLLHAQRWDPHRHRQQLQLEYLRHTLRQAPWDQLRQQMNHPWTLNLGFF